MIRVGINGFGRIGRAFLRAAQGDGAAEVVAINDLGDLENLAYLLRHDSVYRDFGVEVKIAGDSLVVGGKAIKFLKEKDPAKLPWKDLSIDIAIESTGVFDSFEKASAHITAGAKRFVISSPVKDYIPKVETLLMVLNVEIL
jgi:glyceraldehyde 3-phosphate dehydrogenase